MEDIKIFTTDILDDIKIVEYKGLVTAKVVRALNIFKDIASQFRNIFGGRSKSFEDIINEMEAETIEEILSEAKKKGANAIVGFHVDFDSIGSRNLSFLMVHAKGTAAVIRQVRS